MAETRIKIESLQRYGFTDLASGRQARSKAEANRLARQAIVIIGTDYYLRIFLLFAWAGRLPTSKFADKLLDTYEKFQPRIFGIEANAMQSLFADTVADAAKKKLKKANFMPISQSTRLDKDWRIVNDIEPVLASGRLFVLDDQYDFLSELGGHPTARTKDVIDAFSSALRLIPRKPDARQKNDDLNQLAEYLRKTGVPAWQIKRRIEEFKDGAL
jgi:hypothetical protein